MSDKIPPMPVDVDEVTRFCSDLTDAQFGRYMRMIFCQWKDGHVALDPASVIRDAGLDRDSLDSVKGLMDAKFDVKDGKCVSPQWHEVRNNRFAQAAVRRANGKLGGRPRKDDGASPAEKNEESKAAKARKLREKKLDGFKEFYAAYPRRKARVHAENMWIKHDMYKKKGEVMRALQVASREYADTPQIYIPHPGTWINREMWRDVVDEVRPMQTVDPYNKLAPEWKSQLLQEVQANDRSVMHQLGNIDTERAMRKLAQQKGLI